MRRRAAGQAGGNGGWVVRPQILISALYSGCRELRAARNRVIEAEAAARLDSGNFDYIASDAGYLKLLHAEASLFSEVRKWENAAIKIAQPCQWRWEVHDTEYSQYRRRGSNLCVEAGSGPYKYRCALKIPKQFEGHLIRWVGSGGSATILGICSINCPDVFSDPEPPKEAE